MSRTEHLQDNLDAWKSAKGVPSRAGWFNRELVRHVAVMSDADQLEFLAVAQLTRIPDPKLLVHAFEWEPLGRVATVPNRFEPSRLVALLRVNSLVWRIPGDLVYGTPEWEEEVTPIRAAMTDPIGFAVAGSTDEIRGARALSVLCHPTKVLSQIDDLVEWCGGDPAPRSTDTVALIAWLYANRHRSLTSGEVAVIQGFSRELRLIVAQLSRELWSKVFAALAS